MVTCSECTAACCRLEVPLIGETNVPGWLVDVDPQGNRTMRRLEDGWCAALNRDNMRCIIYESRPLICREFEMGGRDCLTARAEPIQVRP